MLKQDIYRKILIDIFSQGEMQIAQITKLFNAKLREYGIKKNFRETSVSARIRDCARGEYITRDVWKGQTRHVFYIGKNAWKKYA